MSTNTILFGHLIDHGIMTVTGNDAMTFLQGQLTCDMTSVTPQHSQLAGYCNRQGRLHAIMRVYCMNDRDNVPSYLLRLPRDIIEHTLAQLQQYAVFSNVTLADASDTWQLIGVMFSEGTPATSLAEINLPSQHDACQHTKTTLIAAIPGLTQRYEILCQDKHNACIDWLSQHATCVEPNHWQYHDIRAGIPRVHANTIETFTPHNVNLQLINGISFTKGCYLGQEIVARMHHLGKLKQHAYHVTCKADQSLVPTPGDTVVTSDNPDKTIGQLITASYIDNTYHMLLSLQDAYVNQPIALKQSPTLSLQLETLPYCW